MSINSYIKKGIRFVLSSIPTKRVYPQVCCLGLNELLKGRVAFITGGTSGIGYQIAKSYLCAGATVIVAGRSLEKLSLTKNRLIYELKELGVDDVENNVYGLQLDMCKVSNFSESFTKALTLVNKPIDILVNNAGVLGCNFDDGNETEYDVVLNTNLKGVFFLSQFVAHYMKDNHIEGNILNVASSSSLRPANSAYTISKWGVRGLTMGMARTLIPYGIVVNGIAPGPTATPMLMGDENINDISHKRNLSGRYTLPEEIANMAVILVSNMSRMVVGDIVYMTGGAGLLTNDDIDYHFE